MKVARWAALEAFKLRPNPIRELCVPTAKLLSQHHLHNLFLGRRLDGQGINIAKNGKQQLNSHVLQGHSDLTTGKEEGMGGATPSTDQMAKVEQIVVIVQAPRGDNGFQNTSPLKGLYETHVEKLTSSSSKWFDLEWGASSPFSPFASGSSTIASPLRREKPLPFANNIKMGLNKVKG